MLSSGCRLTSCIFAFIIPPFVRSEAGQLDYTAVINGDVQAFWICHIPLPVSLYYLQNPVSAFLFQ